MVGPSSPLDRDQGVGVRQGLRVQAPDFLPGPRAVRPPRYGCNAAPRRQTRSASCSSVSSAASYSGVPRSSRCRSVEACVSAATCRRISSTGSAPESDGALLVRMGGSWMTGFHGLRMKSLTGRDTSVANMPCSGSSALMLGGRPTAATHGPQSPEPRRRTRMSRSQTSSPWCCRTMCPWSRLMNPGRSRNLVPAISCRTCGPAHS